MRILFDNVIAISPAQRRKVVLVFCYSFSTAGAYVVGRSAADALFLTRVGPSWLPSMYLLSACSVGVLAVLSSRFVSGRSLKQVILFTLILFSSISIILCQTLQGFEHAMVLLVGVYLLAEVRGCLNTIHYRILVNELFAHGPDHQHAVGLLGAAATLAGIVFGTLVGFEVDELGTVQLLYVVAGLELVAMIPIAMLPRMETTHDRGNGLIADEPSFTSGLATAARSPYVRGIAILVAVTVMVCTLVEFQWKSSVAAAYVTQEDRMASFFGLFQAATNLITGAIQVLLTGKILHRFGTRTALLVFPSALLASTLGVVFASFQRVVLPAITIAKGCDVLKRSINDPAILILYAPLSGSPRRQAITFVAGVIKPSAEALTALLIISFAGAISTRAISFVALGLLCVWYLVVIRQRTIDTELVTEPERLHESET